MSQKEEEQAAHYDIKDSDINSLYCFKLTKIEKKISLKYLQHKLLSKDFLKRSWGQTSTSPLMAMDVSISDLWNIAGYLLICELIVGLWYLLFADD